MHDIESHYRSMIVRFGPFFLMNGQENHIIIIENNASLSAAFFMSSLQEIEASMTLANFVD